MRKITALIGFAFAITLTGCDDDVTKACKKMVSFAPAKEGASENAGLEECKTRLRDAKTKDPEDFKKTVDCIEAASDMNGFMDCRMDGVAERLGEQIPKKDGEAKTEADAK